VQKAVESQFSLKLQALEFLPAPERLSFAPVDLRGLFRPTEPSTTLLKLRWILAHCSDLSKQKVCEGVHRSSHSMHNFSTSQGNAQVERKLKKFLKKIAVYARKKM